MKKLILPSIILILSLLSACGPIDKYVGRKAKEAAEVEHNKYEKRLKVEAERNIRICTI